MPPREWRLRIEDILGAAARIARYTDGKSLGVFATEVPWAEMRAMRNIVVHEYFGVTKETLWKTAREDLPTIVEPLRRLLEKAGR